MVRMLDDGQHTQACFVAHSLGTTAVSWMLHDTEGEELYWQYYTDSIVLTVLYSTYCEIRWDKIEWDVRLDMIE